MGCIHAEAVIWGKEMKACTHKLDNFGIGVVNIDENLVQIGLLIAEISLFMECELDLHFQGQPQLHHFDERLVKIGHLIIKI